MFKSKLVPNPGFYRIRRSYFVAIVLSSFSIGLVVNILDFPLWVAILAVAFFLVTMGYQIKTGRQMVAGNSGMLEMDESSVRILDSGGSVRQVFEKNNIRKIETAKNYRIPGETLSELAHEISGNNTKNFMVIHDSTGAHRFDFEISSYYMISRLNHFLKQWEVSGITVLPQHQAA